MLFFERISNNIASNIADSLNYDEDKRQVIAYGAYILLDTLLSIFMVIVFGLLFDVLWPALVVSFVSAILRKTSGGAHATTSFRCAAIGTLVAVGFSVLIESISNYFNIYNIFVYFLTAFSISYLIILRLAPVDSPNKPIVKEEKIKALKKQSSRTLVAYAVLCVVLIVTGAFKNSVIMLKYAVLICSGFLWQSFTLTSMGHAVSNILEMPFRYIKLMGGEKE